MPLQNFDRRRIDRLAKLIAVFRCLPDLLYDVIVTAIREVIRIVLVLYLEGRGELDTFVYQFLIASAEDLARFTPSKDRADRVHNR